MAPVFSRGKEITTDCADLPECAGSLLAIRDDGTIMLANQHSIEVFHLNDDKEWILTDFVPVADRPDWIAVNSNGSCACAIWPDKLWLYSMSKEGKFVQLHASLKLDDREPIVQVLWHPSDPDMLYIFRKWQITLISLCRRGACGTPSRLVKQADKEIVGACFRRNCMFLLILLRSGTCLYLNPDLTTVGRFRPFNQILQADECPRCLYSFSPNLLLSYVGGEHILAYDYSTSKSSRHRLASLPANSQKITMHQLNSGLIAIGSSSSDEVSIIVVSSEGRISELSLCEDALFLPMVAGSRHSVWQIGGIGDTLFLLSTGGRLFPFTVSGDAIPPVITEKRPAKVKTTETKQDLDVVVKNARSQLDTLIDECNGQIKELVDAGSTLVGMSNLLGICKERVDSGNPLSMPIISTRLHASSNKAFRKFAQLEQRLDTMNTLLKNNQNKAVAMLSAQIESLRISRTNNKSRRKPQREEQAKSSREPVILHQLDLIRDYALKSMMPARPHVTRVSMGPSTDSEWEVLTATAKQCERVKLKKDGVVRLSDLRSEAHEKQLVEMPSDLSFWTFRENSTVAATPEQSKHGITSTPMASSSRQKSIAGISKDNVKPMVSHQNKEGTQNRSEKKPQKGQAARDTSHVSGVSSQKTEDSVAATDLASMTEDAYSTAMTAGKAAEYEMQTALTDYSESDENSAESVEGSEDSTQEADSPNAFNFDGLTFADNSTLKPSQQSTIPSFGARSGGFSFSIDALASPAVTGPATNPNNVFASSANQENKPAAPLFSMNFGGTNPSFLSQSTDNSQAGGGLFNLFSGATRSDPGSGSSGLLNESLTPSFSFSATTSSNFMTPAPSSQFSMFSTLSLPTITASNTDVKSTNVMSSSTTITAGQLTPSTPGFFSNETGSSIKLQTAAGPAVTTSTNFPVKADTVSTPAFSFAPQQNIKPFFATTPTVEPVISLPSMAEPQNVSTEAAVVSNAHSESGTPSNITTLFTTSNGKSPDVKPSGTDASQQKFTDDKTTVRQTESSDRKLTQTNEQPSDTSSQTGTPTGLFEASKDAAQSSDDTLIGSSRDVQSLNLSVTSENSYPSESPARTNENIFSGNNPFQIQSTTTSAAPFSSFSFSVPATTPSSVSSQATLFSTSPFSLKPPSENTTGQTKTAISSLFKPASISESSIQGALSFPASTVAGSLFKPANTSESSTQGVLTFPASTVAGSLFKPAATTESSTQGTSLFPASTIAGSLFKPAATTESSTHGTSPFLASTIAGSLFKPAATTESSTQGTSLFPTSTVSGSLFKLISTSESATPASTVAGSLFSPTSTSESAPPASTVAGSLFNPASTSESATPTSTVAGSLFKPASTSNSSTQGTLSFPAGTAAGSLFKPSGSQGTSLFGQSSSLFKPASTTESSTIPYFPTTQANALTGSLFRSASTAESSASALPSTQTNTLAGSLFKTTSGPSAQSASSFSGFGSVKTSSESLFKPMTSGSSLFGNSEKPNAPLFASSSLFGGSSSAQTNLPTSVNFSFSSTIAAQNPPKQSLFGSSGLFSLTSSTTPVFSNTITSETKGNTTAATTPLFGAPGTASPQWSFFGGSAPTASQTTSLFGTPGPTTCASSSPFSSGFNKTTTAAPLFGAVTTTSSAASFFSENANKPAAPLFGTSPASFFSSSTSDTSKTTAAPLFGAPGGSLFSNSSSNLFSNSPFNKTIGAPAVSSAAPMFSQSAPFRLFGTTTTSVAATPLFGSSSSKLTTDKADGGVFGGVAASTPLFGGAQASTTFLGSAPNPQAVREEAKSKYSGKSFMNYRQ